MKIIFLDIDGVLQTSSKVNDKYGKLFEEQYVNNLKRIIDETGAKIVISSAWKKLGLSHLRDMWRYRNCPGEILDIIPTMTATFEGYNFRFTTDSDYDFPRGCEINFWRKYISKDDIESYVILDDETHILLHQEKNFVQCSGSLDIDADEYGYGLTNKCTEKAINILNKIK